MNRFSILLTFLCLCFFSFLNASKVTLGCERIFEPEFLALFSGKKIGIITNPTGVNSRQKSTVDVLKDHRNKYGYTLSALFAPEHGIKGDILGVECVQDTFDNEGIPIYSLHGKNFRPTKEMLKDVDVLLYDIQDIGSRSYTFATTLFYAMEEAAKYQIPVVVLDRPNPINGHMIDGPVLHKEWQSIVGYLNIPYCHGMTIGELALFFNGEYDIHCDLKVIPMLGWQRTMAFSDTGIPWIPTSPYIPEQTTPLYYPITGILGELSIVNIGIGFTLPFQLIGAPWIEAEDFAAKLNKHKFPGVTFVPWHYRPFYGKYSQEVCHGVLVRVTDHLRYLPVSTQYLILGTLKNLYPEKFILLLTDAKNRHSMFNKVNGTDEVLKIILDQKHIIWPLRELHSKERAAFRVKRKKYLIPHYGEG